MEYYVSAIIVAAGSSTRMGGVSKQFIKINGKEVIAHTLIAFEQALTIGEIIIVSRKEDIHYIEEIIKENNITKANKITIGGQSRQESVENGLSLLSDQATHIAIHDGARPLVTPAVINKTTIFALKHKASATGVPVKDTIKIVNNNRITATPNRDTLISIQTPQIFEKELYFKALETATENNKNYTDDCSLIEAIGKSPYVALGDYSNIKITTPEDIIIAENILKSRQDEKI